MRTNYFWIATILFIVFLFVLVPVTSGDDLLEEAYERLDISNEVIEKLMADNANLIRRIISLEEELQRMEEQVLDVLQVGDEDAALLTECLVRLESNNAVISGLTDENNKFAYQYKKAKEEVAVWQRKWQLGVGVSYPFGGSIYVAYGFKNLGFFNTTGYINNGIYTQLGIFIRR